MTENEEVEVDGVDYWKDGAANNKFTREGRGSGFFTSQRSGLEPATAYKAQAYATTKIQDTAMGEIISFTTLSE